MTPEYEATYGIETELVVLDEVPVRRTTSNGGINRYTYRVGVVQKIVREVVRHPNKWVLARRDCKNRSTLAPTLARYKQIRWQSRKNDNGLFDIWVSYTPNPDGSMDGLLDADIQSWNSREVEGRDRPNFTD